MLGGCATYGPTEWKGDVTATHILSAEEVSREPIDPAFIAETAAFDRRSAEPTPAAWHTGAIWDFVLYRGRWKRDDALSFQLTDEPADTCIGGEWKQLRVISDPSQSTRSPAYLVEGRNLSILLSTGVCDAYNQLNGVLDARGFLGKHEASGLMHGALHGRVTGKPRVDGDR